jgi:hypothetical protein
MATQKFNIDKINEIVKNLPPPSKDQVIMMGQSSFAEFEKKIVDQMCQTLKVPIEVHPMLEADSVYIADRPKIELKFPAIKYEAPKPFIFKNKIVDKRHKKKHGKTTATSIKKRRKQNFPTKRLEPIKRLFDEIAINFFRQTNDAILRGI